MRIPLSFPVQTYVIYTYDDFTIIVPDLQKLNHWPKRFAAVRYTAYGFTKDNFERGFQGKKQEVGELTGEKAGQHVRNH